MTSCNLHYFSVHCFPMGVFQDTLDASLQSFQQERLSKITELKDQLVTAQHSQTKAIEERHTALLRCWEQLLEASAAYKDKLLEKQLPLLKVNFIKLMSHNKVLIIYILTMGSRNRSWKLCLDNL